MIEDPFSDGVIRSMPTLVQALNLSNRRRLWRQVRHQAHAMLGYGARHDHQISLGRMARDSASPNRFLRHRRQRRNQRQPPGDPALRPRELPSNSFLRQPKVIAQRCDEPSVL